MESFGTSMHGVRLASAIATFVLLAFVCVCLYIWRVERAKVYRMPKKPMTICDEHGPYPSECSVFIDVPQDGKSDLKVELCPVCYHNRLKGISKILEKRDL